MVLSWYGVGGLPSCSGRAEDPEGRALVPAEVAEGAVPLQLQSATNVGNSG